MESTEKLYQVFSNALSIPLKEVNEDLKYQSIPEWDSLAQVYLMTELETEYSIKISTDDLLEMTDVKKVKEILNKNGVEL